MKLRRRTALPLMAAAVLGPSGLLGSAAGVARALSPQEADGGDWYDVRELGVEGRGFDDTQDYFDRLPARAKGVVREAVWNLGRHSAGMMVKFRTDSPVIRAEYEVRSPRLAMPHMPATGVSGLDLYAKDDLGVWGWVAVCKPENAKIKSTLVQGLPNAKRDFAIYLPLYNGTVSMKVGVDRGAHFEPISPRRSKQIVFYGTSITQGACASRPGMPHPAILGRRLNQPVINLGFSGNGKMEQSVGQFLVELDPSIYVIDCLPNMNAAEVETRTVPLVKQLRAERPEVPVVLVEDRSYGASWLLPSLERRNESSRAALKKAMMQLRDAGVDKLHYVDGDGLLSDDRDGTTDGSHPSDLGFSQHADAMEPVLRKALAESAG